MKLEADFVFFFSKGNKISVRFVKLIRLLGKDILDRD